MQVDLTCSSQLYLQGPFLQMRSHSEVLVDCHPSIDALSDSPCGDHLFPAATAVHQEMPLATPSSFLSSFYVTQLGGCVPGGSGGVGRRGVTHCQPSTKTAGHPKDKDLKFIKTDFKFIAIKIIFYYFL